MEQDHPHLALLGRAMKASTLGDERGFAETHTDDVVVFANGIQAGRGRDELMRYWRQWFVPFPNLRLKPTDMMIDDHRIFFDAMMEGTHTGTLTLPDGRTIPPTEREFSVPVMVHFSIRDSKLAAVREAINLNEIIRQLGLGEAAE